MEHDHTAAAGEGRTAKALYTLINERASCRSYHSKPIPEEVLARVLEAGCRSPSGGGFQTLSIIKVSEQQTKEELVKCSRGQKFIAAAPVNLVFCIDFYRMRQVMQTEPAPFDQPDSFPSFWMGLVDCAICAQTITLAAQAEGLASCYNGNIIHRADRVSALLELPELVLPVLMLTLGYPRVTHQQPPKYAPAVLVHDERYRPLSDAQAYRAYRKQNRYQKIPPRPELVEQLCRRAQLLHGADFAERVRADIAQKGFIGSYQYWFGCYYQDEPEFMQLEDYQRFFSQKGFRFLTGTGG